MDTNYTEFKEKLLKTLEQRHLEDLFHLFNENKIQNLAEKDFKEILMKDDLKFLENWLKAIFIIGCKKNITGFDYYTFIRDLADKFRKVILKNLIEILKKLENETLVPILGLELFDILEEEDLIDLHNNSDLYKKVIIALSEFREELFYFKPGYVWSDRYAVSVPNEKDCIIRILKDPEVKDYSPLIETSIFYMKFNEEEFFSIINTPDLRIFETFIRSLKYRNIALNLFPGLGFYFAPTMIKKLAQILEDCNHLVISELLNTDWLDFIGKADLILLLEVVEMRYLKLPRKKKKEIYMALSELRQRIEEFG